MPAAQQQKGFSGAILLTDPVIRHPSSVTVTVTVTVTGKGMGMGMGMGMGILITLWETEADQKACESNGYVQRQLGKMAAVLAGAPLRESFLVRAKT